MKSLGMYLVIVLLMGAVCVAVIVSRMPVSHQAGMAWTATNDRVMKQLEQVGD